MLLWKTKAWDDMYFEGSRKPPELCFQLFCMVENTSHVGAMRKEKREKRKEEFLTRKQYKSAINVISSK